MGIICVGLEDIFVVVETFYARNRAHHCPIVLIDGRNLM